jgi:amidase
MVDDTVCYVFLERAAATDPDDGDVSAGSGRSAVTLANLRGGPDLIVPAGFTGRGLPITLSFLGPAFSEPKLLALGYAFELLTQAYRLPAYTPLLPGDTHSY